MFKLNKPIVAAVCCLAAICLLAAPAVYGDDWDKATRITVNHPFEVPGTVLPAGTYIIKILDLAADRHVVRILSEDETKVYATVLGIPDFRLEPTEKTALTFYESPNNGPLPVHSWFYPNHQFGIEFAYREKRATEIAAVSEEPVVAFRPPEPEPVFREEPTPEPAQLLNEELFEVAPTGEEVEIAALHPPEIVPEPEPEPVLPVELPRTATPFPLFGLVALLAGGAATTLRFLYIK
jgi:hypothetical protein